MQNSTETSVTSTHTSIMSTAVDIVFPSSHFVIKILQIPKFTLIPTLGCIPPMLLRVQCVSIHHVFTVIYVVCM